MVARMVRSSEELQTRAGRLVAEAAAQSVAVVEEAAVVNSQHEATIDKLKRVIAQLQVGLPRLLSRRAPHSERAHTRLCVATQATRQFLEDRVVSSSKDAKEAHTELEKCREEVRRMAATQNQLHQQLGLQKQVSMDLLRRFVPLLALVWPGVAGARGIVTRWWCCHTGSLRSLVAKRRTKP